MKTSNQEKAKLFINKSLDKDFDVYKQLEILHQFANLLLTEIDPEKRSVQNDILCSAISELEKTTRKQRKLMSKAFENLQ